MTKIQKIFKVGLLCGILGGCHHCQYHDPTLQKSETAYETELTAAPTDIISPYEPPMPNEQNPALTTPIKLGICGTFSVHEAMAHVALRTGLNIVVDQNIHADVLIVKKIYRVLDLIQQLCTTHGWAYRVQADTITIFPDAPYAEIYNVHFLNTKRHNESSVSIGTEVLSGIGEEKANTNAHNGTATKITGSSTTDFWQELEDNIKVFLISTDKPVVEVPGQGSKYTFHKQAGLLTVVAHHKQHEHIRQYLQMLKESIATQVVIEAKIIEVSLNEQFQSGIDWFAMKKHFMASSPLGSLATPGGVVTGRTFGVRNVMSLGATGHNISGLIHALNVFGTVRTLSNPRITVLNNQAALLKVATNYVYFKVNYNRDFNVTGQASFERASSQVHTVPVGLIFTVQPSIHFDTGHVTLSLHPTISRIVEEVEDPAVGILTGNQKTAKVPVVQMREMNSIIQLKSGDVVILGGLMEERSDNTHSRNPLPGLEKLMRAKEDHRMITELVIFLRVYILPSGQSGALGADKNLYKNFTKDPRKIVF